MYLYMMSQNHLGPWQPPPHPSYSKRLFKSYYFQNF